MSLANLKGAAAVSWSCETYQHVPIVFLYLYLKKTMLLPYILTLLTFDTHVDCCSHLLAEE